MLGRVRSVASDVCLRRLVSVYLPSWLIKSLFD